MTFARKPDREITPAEQAIYTASTTERHRLISLASRPHGDPAIDPEDIVQDTLKSIWGNRDHMLSDEEGGHLEAYIKGSIAKRSLDRVRRQRMREGHGERQLEVLAPSGDVDRLPAAVCVQDTAETFINRIDSEDYFSRMRQGISAAANQEELSQLERQLLVGLYRDEKSYTQLDEEFRLKPGTAKCRLFRARRKLKGNNELRQLAESLGFKKSS